MTKLIMACVPLFPTTKNHRLLYCLSTGVYQENGIMNAALLRDWVPLRDKKHTASAGNPWPVQILFHHH
jgi:hypothetical protein